jgi:ABC-2 type transport system ATP-binding protein
MNVRTVLSAIGLRKEYNGVVAVDNVSFQVNQSEILGLLGPNGAGKTTIINMVLGVLEATRGTIVVEDLEARSHRRQVLELMNVAAAYAPLPGNLTVAQNLRFFGLLYGVKDLRARIDRLLDDFDLRQFRNVKCGVLSSGEQTRVGLAKAFLNRPTLLLLDEPTASLDPAVAHDVRTRVRAYAGQDGVGVLWTSHNMYEIDEVCHRVLFLSRGRILLEGDPKRLPAEHGQRTLEELFITVAREPLVLEPR